MKIWIEPVYKVELRRRSKSGDLITVSLSGRTLDNVSKNEANQDIFSQFIFRRPECPKTFFSCQKGHLGGKKLPDCEISLILKMQVKFGVKIYIFSDFLCPMREGMVGRPRRRDLRGFDLGLQSTASALERERRCIQWDGTGLDCDGTEKGAPDTGESTLT